LAPDLNLGPSEARPTPSLQLPPATTA